MFFVCLFDTHALINVFDLICKEHDTCISHLLLFWCCVIIAVLVTQGYRHPWYKQHALCGVPQGVRVAWLLLALSPFRAPWPIKGLHRYPMMPWEVKSFPVKRCYRNYARLGWHCFWALLRHIESPWWSMVECRLNLYEPSVIFR